jgi:VIT1/CCC1 family predicted Fe2+/Mn2+ transporter
MFSSRAAASRVAIVVVAAVIIALGFLGIGVAWLAKKTPRLPRGGRAILRS